MIRSLNHNRRKQRESRQSRLVGHVETSSVGSGCGSPVAIVMLGSVELSLVSAVKIGGSGYDKPSAVLAVSPGYIAACSVLSALVRPVEYG